MPIESGKLTDTEEKGHWGGRSTQFSNCLAWTPHKTVRNVIKRIEVNELLNRLPTSDLELNPIHRGMCGCGESYNYGMPWFRSRSLVDHKCPQQRWA